MSARRVPQEKPQGEFASLWKEALAADTELEQVELNAALADIMSTKDATEQVTAVLARVAQLGPSPSPNPSPEPYPNPSPSPKPPCTHAARASAGTPSRPESPVSDVAASCHLRRASSGRRSSRRW